jgi:hypothetical protein
MHNAPFEVVYTGLHSSDLNYSVLISKIQSYANFLHFYLFIRSAFCKELPAFLIGNLVTAIFKLQEVYMVQ